MYKYHHVNISPFIQCQMPLSFEYILTFHGGISMESSFVFKAKTSYVGVCCKVAGLNFYQVDYQLVDVVEEFMFACLSFLF